MIYHDFKDIKLPAFALTNYGFDYEGKEALYDLAMEKGVNLFEVYEAYGQENPETEFAKIMSKYPREDYQISAGFKGYVLEEFGKQEEIFEQQLINLNTDHIDFYTLHNVTEFNLDFYLDGAETERMEADKQRAAAEGRAVGDSAVAYNGMPANGKNGLVDYFIEQKANGKIRYLGASFIGNIYAMKMFVEKYGEYLDYVRFTLNWMDWDLHRAKQKLALAKAKGLPVFSADPFKGELLKEKEAESIRYQKSFPEVVTTLAEVKDAETLNRVIEEFGTEDATTEEENKALYDEAKAMLPKRVLNCTGCRLCMRHCIKKLDIAGFMEMYNEEIVNGPSLEAPMYVLAYEYEKQPKACCHWGPCQSMCPQKLDIIRMMLPLVTKIRRNPYVKNPDIIKD